MTSLRSSTVLTAELIKPITFRISFHGPFHIASGQSQGGDDLTVNRDNPLPATSLKGVMRAAAEQRLRVDRDLSVRIFGDEVARGSDDRKYGASSWAWSDADIPPAERHVRSSARIKMSPDGVVADGALQIGQNVWAGSATFTVTPTRPLGSDEAAAHRVVLRAAARAVSALGGGRRRGDGWVSICDDDKWTEADTVKLLALQSVQTFPTEMITPDPVSTLTAAALGAFATLTYRITAEQHISAGVGAEIGNNQHAHTVLPGSVIRGALATRWMMEHHLAVADQRMADLFERDIVVRQAVPVDSTLTSVSAMRAKYPGGTGSALLPFDRAEDALAGLPAQEGGEIGYEAGRGWELPEGFNLANITRTALAEDTTAQDGALFTTASVKPKVVFTGTVLVQRSETAFRAWLNEPKTLRLGGQRTVAGQARWELVGETALQPPPIDGQVILRCRSPLIALDEFGANTLDPTRVVQAVFPQARVDQSWTRSTRVTGWHMASGLPKPDDYAIAAGSTILVSGLPTDAHDALTLGLGLRRQEGYGEVEIVDVRSVAISSGPIATVPAAPSPRETVTPSMAHPRAGGPFDILGRLTTPAELSEILRGIADLAMTLHQLRADGRYSATADAVLGATTRPWLRAKSQAVIAEVTKLLTPTKDAVLPRLAQAALAELSRLEKP